MALRSLAGFLWALDPRLPFKSFSFVAFRLQLARRAPRTAKAAPRPRCSAAYRMACTVEVGAS
jgi:hypothetical protein